MRKLLTYRVAQVAPYINWLYFFHAWGMDGRKRETAQGQELLAAARKRLEAWSNRTTKALFMVATGGSEGDNLEIEGTRIPLLRQQRAQAGSPSLCLSDFVRPLSLGGDKIGLFATTIPPSDEECGCSDGCCNLHDPYEHLLVQTLSDRLAEATAELMHQEVRTCYWGYVPDEKLTIEELHAERFQGIRPAIGYPSLPDFSINFILDRLLHMQEIGITLSPSGMMQPHASVSGLMLAHPQSRYFDVGPIDETQLADYAHRRGMPLEEVKKFLARNLLHL